MAVDRVRIETGLAGLQADDVAVLAHELVWRQPFANANHRTVTAALLEEFQADASIDAVKQVSEPLFEESKRLLDGSDRTLTDAQAKALHLGVLRRLTDALQSMR